MPDVACTPVRDVRPHGLTLSDRHDARPGVAPPGTGATALRERHLCVRRSGVLGVEMKTLPVNVKVVLTHLSLQSSQGKPAFTPVMVKRTLSARPCMPTTHT